MDGLCKSAAPAPGGLARGGGVRGLPEEVRATVWMLASAVTFTAMMTLVKVLGATYGASLQTFFRQLAGAIVLIPFVIRYGPAAAFSTAAPVGLLIRALLSVGGLILAFYSFQKMPLAQANTLAFTRPFWVTLLAALVLHERPDRTQLMALAVGFAGVLLIARPTSGAFQAMPALAGIASALMFAGTMVTLRKLSSVHGTLSLLSWSAALGLALSLVPAVLDWRWPHGWDWALLFAMGGLAVVNQFCFVRAVQIGSPTAMATLDNVRLPLAVLAGFLVFAETPDAVSLAGMVVVAGAALLATLRKSAARPRAVEG
jgi:drug/metabolite transporter (DMT)-like permease